MKSIAANARSDLCVNVLFIHQNFPAQFGALASALSQETDCHVAAIGSETAGSVPGVRLFQYAFGAQDLRPTHAFARRFDLDCRRAEQVIYVASEIVASGFVPDIVIVHPGWGEALPLRALFPKARLVVYCEYYYRAVGADVGFNPQDPPLSRDGEVTLRAKNAASLLALVDCDLAISPTHWQRSGYPVEFQGKISVCHEGIDTDFVRPDCDAAIPLQGGLSLRAGEEVVTFIARDLEPIRGYLEFMRALPILLKRRPRVQIVIVGRDGVSYGAEPPQGHSWKSIGLREVESDIDRTRVHFLGRLPYRDYLRVLQVSAVHVYLTHPFVLSWSLLEAMSAGCAVVASDTAPCREVIDGTNGLLVDIFDAKAISDRISSLLADWKGTSALRHSARETVKRLYNKQTCTTRLMELLRG